MRKFDGVKLKVVIYEYEHIMGWASLALWGLGQAGLANGFEGRMEKHYASRGAEPRTHSKRCRVY